MLLKNVARYCLYVKYIYTADMCEVAEAHSSINHAQGIFYN